MSDKKELTTKQLLFCNEYLSNGFNATQAGIKAGYSEDTAMQMGYENLKKPYIRQYLDLEIDFMLSDRKELTKKIIDECKKYAFMDAIDMEEQQVRASDKKGYLELLSKYLSLFVERKEVEHSTIDDEGKKVGIDYSKLSTKALEEIAKASN